MIKRYRFIGAAVVCAAVLFALSGCSKITVLRVREIRAIEAHADSLHAEQTAYQLHLAEEQNRFLLQHLRQQNELLMAELQTSIEAQRQMRAEQRVRFNEIDNKISVIQNNLFESQSKLVRLDRQTAEVGRRIEQQIAAQEEAVLQRQLQLEGLFDIAMSDFNAGRYDLAMSGFRDLMKQFSDSPQAIEAEYWIAESHYAKEDFEAAEKAYFEFVRKHTESDKYCVALYKLSLSYERQEKTRSRDTVWRNLLDRCGRTTEAEAVRAAMAAERLEKKEAE